VPPELLVADAHLVAAPMAARERAVLSHGTAAWRWRIVSAPPVAIEVSVPHRRAQADGIALHRIEAPQPGDIT
jgi:hypothetical protein